MAIEEPPFDLVRKDGPFELRDYAASVVAEVHVTGDQDTAGRVGFRHLAGYIFGGNASAQKIAMTAPVTKLPASEKIAMTAPVALTGEGTTVWRVRFTMPRAYALADLPVPIDPEVRLVALPAYRAAVLRFSGFVGPEQVGDRTAELLAQVHARALVAAGPVSLLRYNPPWTPWFLRRNEISLPVIAA